MRKKVPGTTLRMRKVVPGTFLRGPGCDGLGLIPWTGHDYVGCLEQIQADAGSPARQVGRAAAANVTIEGAVEGCSRA